MLPETEGGLLLPLPRIAFFYGLMTDVSTETKVFILFLLGSFGADKHFYLQYLK